ncbi:MAG: sugar phosphate nucleotidyltransferase [Planctomycetota bacterium]
MVRGVILAGGLGTRLHPLTKVTNKHLLPVYNKPMIYYPIQCLKNAGVEEILIVTGGTSAGDFLRLLGDGEEFGVNLYYAYQKGEGGIAEALGLAESFARDDRVCVVLGDNVIERNICKAVQAFREQRVGARILLKEVPDPHRFGVAELSGERVVRILEKPPDPVTNLAVIGIYLYDSHVFEIVKTLEPSARGELEITDVNNQYIREGTMRYEVLEGWWTDAGTFDSLLRATNLVREGGANKME